MAEPLDYTEELRRVGAELRAAREAQGLDLAAVAAQCRVRGRYLEAIEAGAVQQLPEPVFVQGFIRTYARSLGLDPDSLAAESLAVATLNRSEPSPSQSPRRLTLPSKPVLGFAALIGVILVTLLGTGWAVWYWRQQQVAIVPTEGTEPPPPPTEAIVPATPVAVPNAIAIAFRGPAWAEIRVDGEVVFMGMGSAGQELSFEPQQELTINPGRPDLIWLSRAGEEAQPLGTISDVRIYRFSSPAAPASAAQEPTEPVDIIQESAPR